MKGGLRLYRPQEHSSSSGTLNIWSAMTVPGPRIKLPSEPPSFGFGKVGPPHGRHLAVRVVNDTILEIFYSMKFLPRKSLPERIRICSVSLQQTWSQNAVWICSSSRDLVTPQTQYEGQFAPVGGMGGGGSGKLHREVRDPSVFEDDDGSIYLAYSAGRETSVAVAKLHRYMQQKS